MSAYHISTFSENGHFYFKLPVFFEAFVSSNYWLRNERYTMHFVPGGVACY